MAERAHTCGSDILHVLRDTQPAVGASSLCHFQEPCLDLQGVLTHVATGTLGVFLSANGGQRRMRASVCGVPLRRVPTPGQQDPEGARSIIFDE